MSSQTQEQEAALKAYKKADTGKKKMLETIFGKTLFAPKPENAMEKIKSFEDACKVKKYNPKTILPYPKPQNEDEEALNAVRMQWIICDALRGDWTPDFANEDQYKYYPWFRWNEAGGGFGFGASGCGSTDACSGIGSRLCFPTSAMSDYFGKQFIELHRQVLQYKKAA